MPEEFLSLVIADESLLFAEGLKKLLESQFPSAQVAMSRRDLMEQVGGGMPDLVICGLKLPDGDGIELTEEVRRQHPKARVLILSDLVSQTLVRNAFQAGASGFLTHQSDPGELRLAVKEILGGSLYISSKAAQGLLHPSGGCPSAARRLEDLGSTKEVSAGPGRRPEVGRASLLTPRQLDTARLVAEGLSNREIAERLGISSVTVRTHLAQAFDRLGLSNRVQLALYALRAGWTGLD